MYAYYILYHPLLSHVPLSVRLPSLSLCLLFFPSFSLGQLLLGCRLRLGSTTGFVVGLSLFLQTQL